MGNSGGWGRGPSVFGRLENKKTNYFPNENEMQLKIYLLYAISQHETAMATATRARSAVMTSAMMRPILDTHTSSSPTERTVRSSCRRLEKVLFKKISKFVREMWCCIYLGVRSMVMMAFDWTCISSLSCPV